MVGAETMNLWELPKEACIGGVNYPINGDFRDILEIFSYWNDPDVPEFLRWPIALALFYEGEIPREHRQEAMDFLADFIRCGQPDTPGPRLLDWEQDAPVILADVNKVAGQEVRALPHVHWWTFLGWFQGVGQGQLSTIVAIRDKLRRGKPLEKWEQDFLRENPGKVKLRKRYSAEELAQQARLQNLLGG